MGEKIRVSGIFIDPRAPLTICQINDVTRVEEEGQGGGGSGEVYKVIMIGMMIYAPSNATKKLHATYNKYVTFFPVAPHNHHKVHNYLSFQISSKKDVVNI